MSKKSNRGFFSKSAAQLQHSSELADDVLTMAMTRVRADRDKADAPEGWPCDYSLQDENEANAWYEDNWAFEDDPLLYPGAILAWRRGGFGVRLDGAARNAFLEGLRAGTCAELCAITCADAGADAAKVEGEDAARDTALGCSLDDRLTEGLFEAVWPCALIDVRFCGFHLYEMRVDSLFCYPTFDEVNGQRIIGVVAIGPCRGREDFICAKIVVEGGTFAEIREASRNTYEIERSKRRAAMLGILPTRVRHEVFDPFATEPDLGDFAITLLAAMTQAGCWEADSEGSVDLRRYSSIVDERERWTFLDHVRDENAENVKQWKALGSSTADSIRDYIAEMKENAKREEAEAAERERLEAAKKERLRAERAEREREKKIAREKKAEERARRKAENIAEAKRKAEAKAKRLQERERRRAEEVELSVIAAEIHRLESEEHASEAGTKEPETRFAETAETQDVRSTAGAASRIDRDSNAPLPAEEISRAGQDRGAAGAAAPDETVDLGLQPEDDSCEEPSSDASAIDVNSSWAAYELRRLTDENTRLKERLIASESRATFAERMQVPTNATEALALALDAFPDRLAVVPSVFESAEKYRGDVAEAWAVLQSMACTLHPLIFGECKGSLARAFQAESGFELALRDVKQENRRHEASGSRKVEWKGQVCDMTPHVKGRGTKRGQTLRAHFFADYEEQLIVLGHFGEHLESYQTSKI